MRETRSGSGGNRGNDNGLASDTKGKKKDHHSFIVCCWWCIVLCDDDGELMMEGIDFEAPCRPPQSSATNTNSTHCNRT